MTKTLAQFEKNVGISFSYVKKDLLSVNDSVSDLHDQIQHLSLNQAMLLEKVAEFEKRFLENKAKAPSKKKSPKKSSKKAAPKKSAKKIVKKETITYQ